MRTIDDDIALVEQNLKTHRELIANNSHCVDRLQTELSGLRARKAQQEAEASRTVGQRVAERQVDSTYCEDIRIGGNRSGFADKSEFCFVKPAEYADGTVCDQERIQLVLGKILDKALADERKAIEDIVRDAENVMGSFKDIVRAIRART